MLKSVIVVGLALSAGFSSANAQALEDAGAILLDASSYFEGGWGLRARFTEQWGYDETAERKTTKILGENREVLVFGGYSKVQVQTYISNFPPQIKDVPGVRASFVVDKSKCVVEAGVYAATEPEWVTKAEKLVLSMNPQSRPSVETLNEMATSSFESRRFYLNNVLLDETTKSFGNDYIEYALTGLDPVMCSMRKTFEDAPPQKPRATSDCTRTAKFRMTLQNADRFEKMLRVVYGKLCTGAERPKDKF